MSCCLFLHLVINQMMEKEEKINSNKKSSIHLEEFQCQGIIENPLNTNFFKSRSISLSECFPLFDCNKTLLVLTRFNYNTELFTCLYQINKSSFVMHSCRWIFFYFFSWYAVLFLFPASATLEQVDSMILT